MKPTGIILAGGKSSRMGQDKGLIHFAGKPMIQHVIEPMKEVCDRILIVSRNPEYSQFHLERIEDEQPDYGPVMGILSGLSQSSSDLNVILSCDVPNVNSAFLLQLIDAIGKHDIAAARSSSGIHPLVAVYNRGTQQTFEKAVEDKEHRLRTVISGFKTVEVMVEDENLVKNFNLPEDFEQ